MKYFIITTWLFCALFISTAFAENGRYLGLHYQINGITNPDAEKNAGITLQNLYSKHHFPLKASEVQHFIDKAPLSIKNAIAPYGFFRSKVTTQVTKGPKTWNAVFTVTPGPPLPISAMEIHIIGAGKDDPRFLEWKTKLPFHVGDTLQTKPYEHAKAELYNIATRRGYFDAKMQKTEIQINLTTYQSTIIIIFDSGPRYRFGDTEFTETPFYEKFLRKFLTYHAGEYYDATELENTQAGLLRGNYFSQVRIAPKIKEAKNNIVPIKVSLIPLKSRTYTFGAGYGSDTGIRGTAGITLRRIGHEGQRFKTLIRGSQRDSSFVAKYLIPGFNPANDLFSIGAGASNLSQSTGNANNIKFGPSYTITRDRWKYFFSLDYLNEYYNITSLPYTTTELVYPTISASYLYSNNSSHPKRGISFNIQLTGASEKLLSETSFYQAIAGLKTLYTIEPTHTRLLFRTNVGHTSINNLDNLPLSLQLFAGGSRSVRGFGYNSIGPGKELVVASYEVQQRIKGPFYLAGLVDAGVVATTNIFQHINVGSGPGIAWISPIGTIELTYAEAITQSNKPWSFQFTMGTDL